MEMEPWLRFAHIGGAMVWIGGGVMLSTLGSRVRRSDDMAIVGEFARTLSFVGVRVFAPAVVLVLASGIWLVIQQSRDFSELWVLLALAAFVAAFVVGAVVQGRIAIALGRVASGPDPDPRVARAIFGRWIVSYLVVLAILAFAVWDMIFKPGT
jgi:uncharacterized membrane protein